MVSKKDKVSNPPNLVKNQHIHAACLIKQFYDRDNQVDMQLKTYTRPRRVGKNSSIFTTLLTWNQKAERDMKLIEEDLHIELKKTIKNGGNFLQRNHIVITKYSLLWRLRFNFHVSPPESECFSHLTPPTLTEKDKNLHDRWGAMYIENTGEVASKNVASIQIFGHLSLLMDQYKDLKWGLLTAVDGEFLVADCYGDLPYMPITPNLAFMAGVRDQAISRRDVAQLNRESIARATKFYFARYVEQCPVT